MSQADCMTTQVNEVWMLVHALRRVAISLSRRHVSKPNQLNLAVSASIACLTIMFVYMCWLLALESRSVCFH